MKKYIFFLLLISVASNLEINTQSNLTDIYQKTLNLKKLMQFPYLQNKLLQSKEMKNAYVTLIRNFLKDILKNNTSKYKLDPKFNETIMKYLNNSETEYIFEFYLIKFIIDSSKNKDDITNYRECTEKYYTYEDLKNTNEKTGYYLINVDKRLNSIIRKEKCANKSISEKDKIRFSCNENDTINFPSFFFEELSYSVGLCLPLFQVENLENNIINLIIEISLYDNFNLLEFQDKDNANEELNVIIMNNTDSKFNKENTKIHLDDLIGFIPLIIIIIIIIFMFIEKLPKKILKKYFLKNNENIDLKEFENFQKNFFLKENWNELFDYSHPKMKINNDSNLPYIKGLRGISMIFTLFGFVYFTLFNSQVFIYSSKSFLNLLKSFFYPVFYGGIRFGPRFLLSSSGYILSYKFISFIDNNNNNLNNFELNDSKNKIKTNDDDDDDESEIDKNEHNKNYLNEKNNFNNITLSLLFRFYFYQIHKYILYIITLSFCVFSLPNLYKIESLFYPKKKGIFLKPSWKYFYYEYIDEVKTTLNLFLGFLSLFPFKYLDINNSNFLFFFWLFHNEVIFFIITSLIIYLGYKYKLKIDIFFIIIIIITIIIKIILHFTLNPFSHEILYYYDYDFGSIFINPLYNYDFYLIGVYFGMLNFTIQKDFTIDKAKQQEKNFLFNLIEQVEFLKKKTILLKFFLFCIFFLFTLFPYSHFFFKDFDKAEKFIFGSFNNFILCFDIEIIIFCSHLLLFLFFIDYENIIHNIFSSSFWLIFNKLYVSFIITIFPVILYILFHNEIRINLNIYNCFYYSIISSFFGFFISVFCYIFFELPCKRIIKLISNYEN